MMKIKRNILLNPGPATTTDSVKMAQVVPDICHREKEFCNIVESIRNDLAKIALGDDNYVAVLFGGSGTAGMDAIINSVVPPDKKILAVNNGAYGSRIAQIAKAYSIDLFELKFEVDQLPDVNKIEKILKEDNKIACIAVVHHETTTGLLNPVKEMGKLAKKYNKVFIVDTISSFAGIPLNIKEFNIDFMASTSNKCIQGMAGICFVICKKQELEKIKNYKRRSFYLSLYDEYEYFEKNHEMRFTPPVQTMYALRKAIDEFFEEGAENRHLRYAKNWQALRKGMGNIGFKILTNQEEESHLLITVLYPKDPNFNFNTLHDKLYEKGFTIYPGKVGGLNTFRLANMGSINPIDIEKFIFELKNTLKDMGVDFKK